MIFFPPSDRDFFLVTVDLPDGSTTDPLPLLITDIITFLPTGKVHGLRPNWQKKLFSRFMDGIRNHLDLHDLDPDHAFLESIQALFYDPSKELNLQVDKLIQLFYNPTVNKVLIWPTALQHHVHGHNLRDDTNPHHLRICFLGHAQHLLNEALLPASAISVSDSKHSPEMLSKISTLIHEILRESFSQQISLSSSPSTPPKKIRTYYFMSYLFTRFGW
jgi:hypothetical protein